MRRAIIVNVLKGHGTQNKNAIYPVNLETRATEEWKLWRAMIAIVLKGNGTKKKKEAKSHLLALLKLKPTESYNTELVFYWIVKFLVIDMRFPFVLRSVFYEASLSILLCIA